MSPVYLNPQHSSSIPFLELKGDHNQQHNPPSIMGYVHDYVTNTNNHSYFSGSNLDNHHASNTQFLAMDYSRCSQEKVVEKMILSHEKPIVYPFDHQDHEKPKKCKPTKLRIMQRSTTKKIIGDNHKVEHDHNHNLVVQPQQSNKYWNTTRNDGIRMCTDCHTTTTPLWRSGPHGPKSLCNACGIRQRKARRAAMAAAAAASSAEFAKDGAQTSSMSSTTTTLDEAPNLVVEDMRSEIKLPLKKRSKTFNATWSYNHNNNHTNIKNNNDKNIFDNNNNYHNEDFALNSRNKICTKVNSSQRVFPRDEEEGAILLMALSCGLACSS